MVGTSLGPYTVVEQLGAGGMGEVWLAEDSRLGRKVAIKLLPAALAEDDERIARLEREAKVLAQLNHPNIAGIHGLESDGPAHFIVMEFVDGSDLGALLANGPLSLDATLKIGLQVAEALEVAHEAGIVHRDLKPANIRVITDGPAAGQAKVLDFGLAKAHQSDGVAADISPELSASPTMAVGTLAGTILGTAAYMSPEQARGRAVDKRSDVWALGAVLPPAPCCCGRETAARSSWGVGVAASI